MLPFNSDNLQRGEVMLRAASELLMNTVLAVEDLSELSPDCELFFGRKSLLIEIAAST